MESAFGKTSLPRYKPYYFDTVEDFNAYIQATDYKVKENGEIKQGVCMALEDQTDPMYPHKHNFVIHMPDKAFKSPKGFSKAIPDQSNSVWSPYISKPDLMSYARYQHNGMAFTQSVLANQLLYKYTNDYHGWIAMLLQPIPTETSVADPFEIALASLMPLFLLLGYIPPVYNLTFKIVREKESRTKETMRIMGMTDLAYWLSWFVFYTLINTVVTSLAWGMLLINVINYSQPMYLWMFFWLYG